MTSTDQVRETADKCDEQNIPPAANDKAEKPVVGKTEVMTDDENSEWEDLDEVLDDFNGPKPATESAAIASSSSSSKPADTQNNAGEEEFIKQLEANMLAQLLSGGGEASGKGKAPAVPPPTNDAEEGSLPDHLKFLEGMSAKDFEKFEDELKTEGGRQRILEHIRGSKGSAGETGAAGEQAESFPDTIQRTLERMQESDEKVTVEAQTSQDKLIDASIKRLMEMIDDAAENGGKFDPEQVFNDVIKEMSNKEMLYEPMKEYNIKYGPWLEKNKATLSSEDFENYTTQAGVIKKIVEKFESKDYSDDKPECLASIWDLMQQMEACGAPPEDLIKGSMGDGVLPSLSSFLDIPEGDIPKDFDPSQVPPECNTQ